MKDNNHLKLVFIVLALLAFSCCKQKSEEELIQEINLAYKQENYVHALALCDDLLKANPKNSRALLNKGIIQVQMKNYFEAIGTLSKSIEIENNPEAVYYLGLAYDQIGNKTLAARYYEQSMQIGDYFPKALTNLGVLLLKEKRPVEAIGKLKIALLLDSTSSNIYLNIGLAYENMQMFEDAIPFYDKAISLSVKDDYAHYCRGLAYARLKDYRTAVNSFDNAININPNSPTYYRDRGITYYQMGNLQEACLNWFLCQKIDSNMAKKYINGFCK